MCLRPNEVRVAGAKAHQLRAFRHRRFTRDVYVTRPRGGARGAAAREHSAQRGAAAEMAFCDLASGSLETTKLLQLTELT